MTFRCSDCGDELTLDAVATHRCAPVEVDVPLVMGEASGWRAWKVKRVGPVLRLVSATHRSTWRPDEWTRATCGGSSRCSKSLDGRCPGESCSCGMYAAKTRDDLLGMGYNRWTHQQDVVIGEVALAGKVIEGSQGWKAEKARIVRVQVSPLRWQLVERLQAEYGRWGATFEVAPTLTRGEV